jgi:heme a synthase
MSNTNTALHRFICVLAVFTFFLIIVGGLVTSNEAGLSVPDWPKSYGMWMPPMVGNVFYEHGHRMVATFVGFLTIILTVWVWRKEPRRWVRTLGLIALPAVIAQGILGGLTVKFLLPTWISTFHATLAQSFFALIVSLALFTSPGWNTKAAVAPTRPPRLPLLLAIAVMIQLILGAWMRHSNAALAIPTFPLAFGRIIPEFNAPGIAIHFAHRVWALVVFGLITANLIVVLRRYRQTPLLSPAVFLFVLACVQIVLGAYTVLTATAVPVATAHVAVGALILATAVVQTLWASRNYQLAESRTARLQVAAKSV